VPHLQFEIPRRTQQGVFTTLEGLLVKATEDLEATLPLYHAQAPEQAPALEAFCEKLRGLRDEANMPYQVVLDDTSGNSFLENPVAPASDPDMAAVYYTRSVQQNHALGLYAENSGEGVDAEHAATAGMGALDETPAGGATAAGGPGQQTEWSIDPHALHGSKAVTSAQYTSKDPKLLKHGALIREATAAAAATVGHRSGGSGGQSAPLGSGLLFDSSRGNNLKEVMSFPVDCYACGIPGHTRMCVTDVPHFREIILMAFSCDNCGFRDVEVKPGGAIPEHGTVITLKLDGRENMAVDLRRDCIKSDSASIQIPELDFEMEHGSLGGMYTTVEGLLGSVEERLKMSNRFSLESGDSAKGTVVAGSAAASDAADAAAKAAAAGVHIMESEKPVSSADAFAAWWVRFQACKVGEAPFTLIMRDPMSSSYIWSPWEDEETGDKSGDPRMTIEKYERTYEERLDMGLVDMKTENYGELEAVAEDEAAEAAGTPEG
jgi:zinc finger protein